MNRITKQLLREISNLQIVLAEEKQKNKNLGKSLDIEKNYTNILEKEKLKNIHAFLAGIGFTIVFYLFIKICIYFFF